MLYMLTTPKSASPGLVSPLSYRLVNPAFYLTSSLRCLMGIWTELLIFLLTSAALLVFLISVILSQRITCAQKPGVSFDSPLFLKSHINLSLLKYNLNLVISWHFRWCHLHPSHSVWLLQASELLPAFTWAFWVSQVTRTATGGILYKGTLPEVFQSPPISLIKHEFPAVAPKAFLIWPRLPSDCISCSALFH